MSQVDDIISQALALAETQSSNVTTYTDAAQTAASGGVSFSFPIDNIPEERDFTADEPNVYIPEKADKTVIAAEFDRIYALLLNMAVTKIGDFLTAYFPLTNDAYDEATAWLVNTITNGGTGIPAAIEAQIWNRERDRVNRDNLRAQSDALAVFATRGFSMPTGALAAQLQELRVDGLSKNAESSRNTAIKQIEIEIENIRFAVEKALDMRVKAVEAAVGYIRALMTAPDVASRYAFQVIDQQAALINAAANFYNARLNRDELVFKSEVARQEIGTKQIHLAVEQFQYQIEGRVKAAVEAADAAAKTAQAALSALNSIASVTQEL